MTTKPLPATSLTNQPAAAEPPRPKAQDAGKIPETGGPKGPEPTRYGDWEINGRCVDF